MNRALKEKVKDRTAELEEKTRPLAEAETFAALGKMMPCSGWPPCAPMCPKKGEQMVRYYGYYIPAVGRDRGSRKKADQDGLLRCILQPEESCKACRKNWARLIQKIYEVDPLTCLKCNGPMCVISIIEDQKVIKKILKHPAPAG